MDESNDYTERALICRRKPPAIESYWGEQEPPKCKAMIITLDPINTESFKQIKDNAIDLREQNMGRVLVCILVSSHRKFDEAELEIMEELEKWCDAEKNIKFFKAPFKDLKEDN